MKLLHAAIVGILAGCAKQPTALNAPTTPPTSGDVVAPSASSKETTYVGPSSTSTPIEAHPAASNDPSRHACKGMNQCKGMGGCKTLASGSSKTSCGAVKPSSGGGGGGGANACKGLNACKGMGNCKTDKHACKGQNDCKGLGGCRG